MLLGKALRKFTYDRQWNSTMRAHTRYSTIRIHSVGGVKRLMFTDMMNTEILLRSMNRQITKDSVVSILTPMIRKFTLTLSRR